ncbi:MAG: VWA domain-containing protein [Candidatus Sulfotelmatobacter sp.]
MNIETAGNEQRPRSTKWLTAARVFGCVAAWLCLSVSATQAQSSPQTQAPQTQAPQTQPAQNQSQSQPQNNDIPDAPTVQPPSETPAPPPIPKPEEKKPVQRDPWTNQPVEKPAASEPGTAGSGTAGSSTAGSGTAGSGAAPGDATSAPPPMPPVKTVPQGSSAKPGPSAQEQLYTFTVHPTFVQVPVRVKDKGGRLVDGLLSTDFIVKENGVAQKLSFFTADPFALSVAIVLDTGMPDAELQKVDQTFPALVGSFAPYDEVAIYTYSSTVSQVSDFGGVTRKLGALLNQIKTERGANNGVPILNGPLANGPIINGVPVGSGTADVNTPPRESHVLNDAVLQAALDLRKRDRTRRKIIFVISDGREMGSRSSYRDVLRVLLSNEIQVEAVSIGSAALPVYDKIERLHVPLQGYGDILPRYASATGGSEYRELTQSSIENMYAAVMSEARNQYTLGYSPVRPKVPTSNPYRSIEVIVDRPGLKVFARDGYYPAPQPPSAQPAPAAR